METENIDVNIIGSWYINNNDKIREEVKNSNYKRMMTIMGYSQIEHMRRKDKKMYDNRLGRDGIIVSVSNFIPNGNLAHDDIDKDILDTLEYVNSHYGGLSSQAIDKVHLDLLAMFNDPGELREDLKLK